MQLDINLSLTRPILIYKAVKPNSLAQRLDKKSISVFGLGLGNLSLKSDTFLQSICSSDISQ